MICYKNMLIMIKQINEIKNMYVTPYYILLSQIVPLTFSLCVSSADVASSNNKIRGFLINARAMAILCF